MRRAAKWTGLLLKGLALLIALYVAWICVRIYVYERSPAAVAARIESQRAAEAQVKEHECNQAFAAGEPLPLGCPIK